MKDYFGKNLEVGDGVAFIETGYRDFQTGFISKIGKAKVTITAQDRHDPNKEETVFRFGCDVIKA